jgi:hypothetical protein
MIGLLLAFTMSVAVNGQVGNGTSPAGTAPRIDTQKYEDQVKQLMEQMQKPDFDFQQFRQGMRDLMQQFQEETKDMDPDQIDKLRQQMMERLQPLFQQNMPTIIQRMRQGMMDSIKKELECTEEEFTALRPSIQAVLDAQQVLGIASGRGPRGGFGGAQSGQASGLQKAKDDLHNALADPQASPSEIKFKMEAFQLEKKRAMQELALAQNNLRSLLTIRQESILVSNGLLE